MMKKAKTKINEEDFEKTISSLTLIGGSLISNGIHGIMRFMCWTKKNICWYEITTDYTDDNYWDIRKLIEDAMETIENTPDKYHPVRITLSDTHYEEDDVRDIRF